MKKIISACLVICIVLQMSIVCFANQTKTFMPEVGSSDVGLYGNRLFLDVNPPSPIEPQLSYYKIIRDEFAKNPNADKISIEWETSWFYYDNIFLNEALEALSLDYPELCLREYEITKWERRQVDEYFYTGIINLELTKRQTYPEAVYSYSERLALANTAVAEKSTRYEKVSAAIDWLGKNVTFDKAPIYNFVTQPVGKFMRAGFGTYSQSFETTGALAQGKATSQGFSKTFQLLMQYANIPVVVAQNGGNMWAYVQMEDGGSWYGLDVSNAALGDYNCFLCAGTLLQIGEDYPDSWKMQYVSRGPNIVRSTDSYMKILTIDAPAGVTVSVTNPNTPLSSGDKFETGSTLNVVCDVTEGNSLTDIYVNGESYMAQYNNGLTLTNVRTDITINPVIAPLPKYVYMTLNTSQNGELTAVYNETQFVQPEKYQLDENSTVTLIPVADTGYEVDYLSITFEDGEQKVYGDKLTDGSYVIENISADFKVYAVFKLSTPPTPPRFETTIGNAVWGNENTLSIPITIESGKSLDACVIVGVFDSDGNFVGVKTQQRVFTSSDTAVFELEHQDGYTYKAMVWSNLTDMIVKSEMKLL